MKRLVRRVTGAARFDASSATSITTVESPTTTNGNLIVVAVRCNSVTITVSSVTDTAGNTYTRIGTVLTSSVTSFEMWYAWNISGNAANFVTANFSSSVGSRAILAVEYEGILNSADPLDTTAGNTGSGLTTATASFTTTEADELLVLMAQQESGSEAWFAYNPDNMGVDIVGTDAVPCICCATEITNATLSGVTRTIASTQSVPRQVRIATFKIADATASGSGGSYSFA